MTELEDRIADVFDAMPMMPHGVMREVARRLPPIMEAVELGAIEQAALVIPFRDLGDEDVVLSLDIRHGFTHLDVSTNAEGVAVSHGYDVFDNDAGTHLHVDREYGGQEVDMAERIGRQCATRIAVEAVERARALMRTHHAFRYMD